jgi:hypothetical protein
MYLDINNKVWIYKIKNGFIWRWYNHYEFIKLYTLIFLYFYSIPNILNILIKPILTTKF